MGALIAGGGSGAVASSAHAGCRRFRLTDPLITGRSRRSLASALGAPDVGGGIPVARWVRAMAFERMVHDQSFVSELLTRSVGLLGLERPSAVRVRSGSDAVATTASELAAAHLKAKHAGEATMLFGLRVPFLGLEGESSSTDVRPDFAIVARRRVGSAAAGSWLIMGDAKDYERVRSRIDDNRMLKGFLQVALGAESAAAWSGLPAGMEVHRHGALAVPRNAYLRPEAAVEDLADHRSEVRGRVAERLQTWGDHGSEPVPEDQLAAHVAHIEATFDPGSCSSCPLFRYCRHELRTCEDPTALLVELGVPPARRPALRGLVDGSGVAPPPATPASLVARVDATVTGRAATTGRLRTDPVGTPGCINVVLVKSDAASLGVHGVAVQRLDGSGGEPWRRRIFAQTNATDTRHAIMTMIGAEVRAVLVSGGGPVHVVVPDEATEDLLVSIADSLAGVELSRLRWQRDLDEGREIVTFDGEPATMPRPLSDDARTAVSLFLEEDRARAFALRQPVVDLREVLASYVVPGGPAYDAGRLDYLVSWAEADEPVDHRALSDSIADGPRTPGARAANAASDAMHEAGRPDRGDPQEYQRLVTEELDYRIDVLRRAQAVLGQRPDSRLRLAFRALELDAQAVWGRRLALEASDLVRFSRTYRWWRNAQVDMLDDDNTCRAHLSVLADRQTADDLAADAGVREIACAEVVDVEPPQLVVRSRRIGAGTDVVLLHGPDGPMVEGPGVTMKVQAGSFKLGQVPHGPLQGMDEDVPQLAWEPLVDPGLSQGDQVIVADMAWFGGGYKSGHEVAVSRPSLDSNAGPKKTCEPSSYTVDPEGHAWCCRPHQAVEADWSDTLAERRARGELNPQVWPPVVDEDRFDPVDAEDVTATLDPGPVPEHLTEDDVG